MLATFNLLLAVGTIVLYFQLKPAGCSGECLGIIFPVGFEQFAVSCLLTVLVMMVLACAAAVNSAWAGRGGWAVGFMVGASSPVLAIAMVFATLELLIPLAILCLAGVGV